MDLEKLKQDIEAYKQSEQEASEIIAELKAENEKLKKDKIGLHSEIKQLEQENFELKESLKCFQTPEAIKALTFYKTGEFELQEKKCIELEQENARLKEEIKEVKKYQYEQEYLEKEIETAKVNLDIGKEEARHYLHEAYKFQKCLQEIKTIAEKNQFYFSPGTIVSYETIKQLATSFEQILKLITKAREE